MTDQKMPAHMLEELPQELMELYDEATSIAPSEDNMARLTRLVAEANRLEKEASDLEIKMMEADEARVKIVRTQIPELMKELGIGVLKLDSGHSIDVSAKHNASIPDAHKREVWEWMEANGHGGLIKTEVTCTFGKGEMEHARAAQSVLVKAGHLAELSQSVHFQTLQSWVKEQLAAGTKLPSGISVFTIEEAVIKPPKGQKAIKRATQKKK